MKFIYKESAMVREEDIAAVAEGIVPYIVKLQEIAKRNDYADAECSINCPFDKVYIDKVKEMAKRGGQ